VLCGKQNLGFCALWQAEFDGYLAGAQANINLNFLYFLMATATCGAVPPLAASITWAKTSKLAAITCE